LSNHTAPAPIYPLSLHDALPISASFHESLLTGQSVTRTLRLENGGEGTLDFTIPDPQPVTAPQPVYPFQLIQKGTRDPRTGPARSEEHTSELQSRFDLVCRLLPE